MPKRASRTQPAEPPTPWGEPSGGLLGQRGAFAAWLLVWLLSASVSAQELTRDATALTYTNGVIALRFDPATGNLLEAGPVNGAPVVRGTAAEIRFANGDWLQQVAYRLIDAEVEPGPDVATPPPWIVGDPAGRPTGTALALTLETDGWRRVERWRMWPGEPFVARTIAWTWRGAEPRRVDLTRLILSGLELPDSELVLPAGFPVSRGPMRDGALPGGSQNNQLAVVENADRAVLALVDGVAEPVSGYLKDGAVVHQFSTQLVAQPNQPFEVGAQVLALSRSGPAAVAEVAHRVHDRFGLRCPTDTPGIEQTVLYSAHAGGTIGSGFRDTGGFVAMTKRLPRLKELGFNCLWLLPFWKGAVYAPSDYHALDPSLGTEADLKALCDEAHRLGMKVLGDLIPHGPKEESGLLAQHPDAVTYNEDGSVKYMWGCLQCDYAQPAWQQYMANHAVDWMKRVGLDGYRVDVAFGGPPNWRPAPGLRPSMSQAYGARQLLATVRTAMKAYDPDSLLLMEGTAPGLCESGDIVYDFPWTYSVLPRSIDLPGEVWVPAAKEWLAWQTALYPRGARFLRYVSSHDTIRGLWKYGPARHKVLLALNAFLPGVPMVYDDEEVGHTAGDGWNRRDPSARTQPSDDPARWTIGTGQRSVTVRLSGHTARLDLDSGSRPHRPPSPAGQLLGIATEQGLVVVTTASYRIVFDPSHGGTIREVTEAKSKEHRLVGEVSLREGRRKLTPGRPPADLLDWQAAPEIEQGDGVVRITFRSPEGSDPGVVRRYVCDPWGIRVETELAFREGLADVNASLTERLPWLVSWSVATTEGVLAGEANDLRPKMTSGAGFRYRHATAPAWSQRQFPAPLGEEFATEQLGGLGLGRIRSDRPGWLQDVQLSAAGFEIGWLAEREPVSLRPNEPVRLGYWLGLADQPAAPPTSSPLHLTETDHYRLAVDRSSGGSIAELRRRTADGWGPNFIDGLVTYSDRGIYGPYRDPAGVEHPTNARSDYDIEPDVTLGADNGRTSTLIEGTFRTPYADGRSIAKPYTRYRHGFATDDTGFELRLGLRIPGGFESGDTPIFAAHILRLVAVRQVTIQAGGQTLVHAAAERDVGRVWQSKAAGALPDSITVQAAGGTMVMAPVSGAERLQNIFLYDAGNGRMTLFFAPFDLQPEQALPIWKESRWRIDLQ